jgi:hypothetical protein
MALQARLKQEAPHGSTAILREKRLRSDTERSTGRLKSEKEKYTSARN